jgi:hypothetical protein
MSSQQFYLLGEPAASARQISIETKSDVDQLKHLIAAHFAVMEPSGLPCSTVPEVDQY